MSFTDSPIVRTDLLDRRWERRLVAASLPVAAAVPWLYASGSLAASWRLSAALMLVVLTALAWRAVGWLGGRTSLARAAWLSDGAWRLEFRDGYVDHADLDAATRLLSPIALLVWRTTRGRCYVLVHSGSGQMMYRRLAGRLRLASGPARRPPQGTGSIA